MDFIGIVIGICCFISAFLVSMFQLLLQIDGYMYVYAQALALIGALGAFFAKENVGFLLNVCMIAIIAVVWFAMEYVIF
ncbi:MAG: hypothetical protein KIG60_04630 [Caryophanon sp.]|nr:hypothetical protein [Caryophanon sp.]